MVYSPPSSCVSVNPLFIVIWSTENCSFSSGSNDDSSAPSAANALDQEAPEGYVYVEVETGISDDSYIQILSGLQEGDTVAYLQTSGGSGDMAMGAMGMMPSGGMGGGMNGGPVAGGGGMSGGPGGGF